MFGEDILQGELVPHSSIKHKYFVLCWGEHLVRVGLVVIIMAGLLAKCHHADCWVVVIMLIGLCTVDLVQHVVIGRAEGIILGMVLIGLHTMNLVQLVVGWAEHIVSTQVHCWVCSDRALTWC